MAAITPQEFVARWGSAELTERAFSQSHFIDLCRLLAGLIERVPELEAHREQPEAPETVEEEPEEVSPRSGTPGPQTAPQRRSLWRRVFGP